jgi:hypothetical protein
LTRFRTAVAILLALFAATALGACGDDGGDEDPQEVLDATFNNDQTVESGVLDISFDLTAEGGDDPGTLEASIGGPFQGGGGGVPQFDMEAEASLESESQDFSGGAGLVSTGDSAFVNFQDTDYEVPAEAFSQFRTAFEQAQAQGQQEGENLLSSLGINPSNWLTDLSNEGDEEVEGTETIHISGQADTPKLIEDLKRITENVPQAAQQVSPAQLDQLDELTDIVETADFDIYTGADDDILRKLEANVELAPPGDEGSPESVTLAFSVTMSEVNEAQSISGPTDAQPLETLLRQFGVDPSQLGQLGAAAGGSGGSTGPSSAATQAYLDCLGTAQGAAALQECEALLEQ